MVCGIDEAGDRLDRIYDVITLFNVLYDVADHTRALASLAKTALPGARLAVFDYLDRGDCQASALADADGPLVPYPLKRADVEGTLGPQAGGWRACGRSMQTTCAGTSPSPERSRPSARRSKDVAGPDGYALVHEFYSGLLDRLRDGRLGGAIILGRRPA